MPHQQSEAELKAAIEKGQKAQTALSEKRRLDEKQCLLKLGYTYCTSESVLTDTIQSLKDAQRKLGDILKAENSEYQKKRKELAELSKEIRLQDPEYNERNHQIECLGRVAKRAKKSSAAAEAAVGIAKAAVAAVVQISESAVEHSSVGEISSIGEDVNSNTSESSDSDSE